jgi:hypothetical protein
MRRPNFFIVGAPKCGTTALHTYLGAHPNLFLCKPKEPNYLSTDFPTHRYVTEEKDYLRLFENASDDETVVGEASAWYLYSSEAIPNIHKFDPQAKIIAMVRNPIDIVPSLHGMLLRNFAEDEENLERAWDLQASRRAGEGFARDRNKGFDPKTCLYADVCKLGTQIERLFDVFPREQVHIIMFDDFVRDTKTCYENVLDFLQVPSDGRTTFPPENVRQSIKSPLVAKAIWKLRDKGTAIKRKLGIVKSFNAMALFRPLYEQTQSRPQLSVEFKERLVDEFKQDVELLSKFLERDLSHWLEPDK